MLRLTASLLLAVLAASSLPAQAPMFPAPAKEHEWLKQFVGEWESEGEASFAGMTIKCKGKETVRSVGGFWIVSDLTSSIMEMPMTAVMTVGYDPEKKKYVGTWLDSHGSHLWKYEGSADAAGKTLTLEAEGPNMMAPGKMAKFRDATEFKGPDHRILTSSMQTEDGKWVPFMTMHFHRKKK